MVPEGTSETSPLLSNDRYNDVSKGGVSEVVAEVSGEEGPQYPGLPEVKKKLKYILPAITIGVFLSAADQTLVAASYGNIGSDLNALNNTSWIATSYFLTVTSFQPLYGKLSDIFGRKPALLFAYAVFGIGCLGCGLSRNMHELIVSRAIAGIGGGGLTTVVAVLMSDIVPLRERGTWQGIINIIYGAGAGIGATGGGFLADTIGWRWSFMGQVPICALAFVTVATVLKMPDVESSHWKSKFYRIDFPGAVVLVSAVFALLLGLDRGSNLSWSAPITIASLAVSLPLFALFILIEQKYASEPFAPGHIIFNKSISAFYPCNFFAFCAWISVLYFLPLFSQAVDSCDATVAGIRLLPGIIAGILGSLFAGLMMQWTGTFYTLTIFAYSTLTLGFIPILLFSGLAAKSTWAISIGLAACGFGNGIGLTTSLVGLIANVSPQDQAVATACSYLFRSLGAAVGLSLSATVVQEALKIQLKEHLGSEGNANAIAEGVRLSLDFIDRLEPGVQDIVRRCYGTATRAGFVLMLGLATLAIVSSCFVREKRLGQ